VPFSKSLETKSFLKRGGKIDNRIECVKLDRLKMNFLYFSSGMREWMEAIAYVSALKGLLPKKILKNMVLRVDWVWWPVL